jgi:hypothetical protein
MRKTTRVCVCPKPHVTCHSGRQDAPEPVSCVYPVWSGASVPACSLTYKSKLGMAIAMHVRYLVRDDVSYTLCYANDKPFKAHLVKQGVVKRHSESHTTGRLPKRLYAVHVVHAICCSSLNPCTRGRSCNEGQQTENKLNQRIHNSELGNNDTANLSCVFIFSLMQGCKIASRS